MTQNTQKTDDRTNSRNANSRKKTSYNRLNEKAWLTAVVRLSANIPTLVSIDLIGKRNEPY